ncbi:MAG: sortase, partial [Methanobacteriaceae archaeon]|nr:sortase [Methanobacteriaceae archaeon]
MRKYKIYSIIIIIISIMISSLIIIKGCHDIEKVETSQRHLEEYKKAPKELLNPEIHTNTGYTVIGKLIIPSIGLEAWIREDTVNAYDSVY